MKTYYLLTKPGIILGNLMTTAGGFALASRGHFDVWLFLTTLIGLGLIIASACILNNYIDREMDLKMERTKQRGFASGTVSLVRGLCLAVVLGILGLTILVSYTNFLTVLLAVGGFLFYVFAYSFSKYHTTFATLIGSISGATPPVIGYTASSGELDFAALLLFLILVLWQMPHFFALAIYRLDEYSAASIPVLPFKKGIFATKVQMLLYCIAFLIATLLLSLGSFYLVVALLLGSSWLWLCIRGFKCSDDKLWARSMFRLSLIVITGLSLVWMY